MSVVLREWFTCPGCGHANCVEWSGSDAEQVIDCVRCRRSVLPINVFDEDGNLLGEEQNPACKCSPQKVEAHFEGERFVVVKFGGSISPDAVVVGLEAIKAAHTTTVNKQVSDFILAHYGHTQQMTLNALLSKATLTQNAELARYVGTALAWVESVIKLYYPLRDAIQAATTPEAVMAVAFNPATAPPDPAVTIESALLL